MLYLPRDTTRVLLYCVEHEKSGALTGLECDLVQLPQRTYIASNCRPCRHRRSAILEYGKPCTSTWCIVSSRGKALLLGCGLRMDSENQPPRKKKCLSLPKPRRSRALKESTNRFAKPVDESVLEKAAKGVVPLKTEQSTIWAVSNFESWRSSRESGSSDAAVPPDILRSNDAELVCKWLCSYVLETRKTDGSLYPPATIRSLVSGLNRHLQENGATFSVFDKNDARFRPLLKTLDSLSCDLHKQGVGAVRNSAKIISEEHECVFWEKNLLGFTTPKVLQCTVFFMLV